MGVVDGVDLPVRRSGGYAPRPVAPILAVGGQRKASFALGRGRRSSGATWVTPTTTGLLGVRARSRFVPGAGGQLHVICGGRPPGLPAIMSGRPGGLPPHSNCNGLLERASRRCSGRGSRRGATRLRSRVAPRRDPRPLHFPEARSSRNSSGRRRLRPAPGLHHPRFAERSGAQVLQVQNHHAHPASCPAGNGVAEPAIGVTFHGTDAAVWGGEFLVGGLHNYRRAGHLRYLPMPGGDQVSREPWRMAAYLGDAGEGSTRPGGARFAPRARDGPHDARPPD